MQIEEGGKYLISIPKIMYQDQSCTAAIPA